MNDLRDLLFARFGAGVRLRVLERLTLRLQAAQLDEEEIVFAKGERHLLPGGEQLRRCVHERGSEGHEPVFSGRTCRGDAGW